MSSEENRYPLIPVTFSSDWDFNDHAATFGIEMSLIHNVFIRGLNSIWYHAPLVKKADAISFAGYSLTWVILIHDHHHGEEEIVFPFLQAKFNMGDNVEQHAAFLKELNAFEEYMTGVFKNKETYDGEKVRGLVEAFGDTLVNHLHEEIPTIAPERLSQYEKKELDAMIDAHSAHIKSQPLTTAFALVGTHHDFKTFPSWSFGLFAT
ncbi:hypothetical protein GALMADRAFT_246427 [Galerina marginata CBS 339.88]|uniref:Hemerythrin-like domain-containing protein n=1 Tax=Galerina marginata (strain CBS 339.88) TaxID=685588 RepID=A0A067T499_GALM3|nr:hypothetical protein GALMADRAFT_246427 [Galerina marginata CBS 339.88]